MIWFFYQVGEIRIVCRYRHNSHRNKGEGIKCIYTYICIYVHTHISVYMCLKWEDIKVGAACHLSNVRSYWFQRVYPNSHPRHGIWSQIWWRDGGNGYLAHLDSCHQHS